MRFTDVMLTFPPIIILTVAAITGPGLWKTVLLNWTVPCRLVRARVLLLCNLEFVQAAQVIDAGDDAPRLSQRP
jgi:ABC-type dipeptide/oligopeptide/nickel transport system permease subunit